MMSACNQSVDAGHILPVVKPLASHNERNSGEDDFIVGALSVHSQRHDHAMTTQQAAESGQLIAFAYDVRNQSETGDKTHPLQAKSTGGHSLNYQPVVAFDWGAGDDSRFHIGVRRLTPTECERLQSLPDRWTDNNQSDSVRYRQLGNAVTVSVIEWIGRRILTIEKEIRKATHPKLT